MCCIFFFFLLMLIMVIKLIENKKYNLKYWYKFVCASLPIIGIIIFVSGQMYNVLSYKYPIDIIGRENDFALNFQQEASNWSNGQRILYVICRNLFVFTTWSNILVSAFLFNSCRNHRKEGMGKFDNSIIGMILYAVLAWIVVSYNLSLPITGAIKLMKWYTYISWFCEHLIIPIASIVYFIFFYNHNFEKINKNKIWIPIIITISIIEFHQILFLIIGLLIKHFHGFPIFGDMSYHGEFPYSYMDITLKKSNVPGVPMWTEFIIIQIMFIVSSAAIFMGMFYSIKSFKKRKDKLGIKNHVNK